MTPTWWALVALVGLGIVLTLSAIRLGPWRVPSPTGADRAAVLSDLPLAWSPEVGHCTPRCAPVRTVLCCLLWRVVPPGPRPLRGRVRDARRRGTDPGEQRQSHHPVPAQPLRRPRAQQRTAHRPEPYPVQPATRDYVVRRTAEGKTNREIKRCLACYVARDLYRILERGAAAA